MRRFFATAALPLTLLACIPSQTDVEGIPVEPAPLATLVDEVAIPYDSFTLDNGLTVLVHTDRKAPVVGVTTYYRVGAKHEPRGRTGFAHLFEHIMFTGSENVENFDIPLEAAGSTGTNGSTDNDRTNYVEIVPTGALDLALMMESDRMGYLLGAVDQAKLDRQRGVVQNEKRQGDNQPYGLIRYKLYDGLFPVGHPYRHSVIGSMADLEAASLTDVRKWFIDNYGPNNVVLALAGDIDAATARPAVERWYGAIPRGPDVVQLPAGPVTLAAPVREEMTDQVPSTLVLRAWSGPGLNEPDAVALAAGMRVLGGLASSRLDNALVRGTEVAVSVSATASLAEQLSLLMVQMEVTPGVEQAVAEAQFDEVIARFLADGPTQDELTRAATQIVSSQIGALEQVGGFDGKGATLAEGQLYSGDPAHYKRELARLAALTPLQVSDAMRRWLGRPSYTLSVVPGERTEDGALMGGWGDEAETAPPPPDPKEPVQAVRSGAPREMPPVAPVGALAFPAVEHATLSNGMRVALARRTAIPKVSLALAFDGGWASDGPARAGTQSLMMDLLEEGTTTRSATEIAELQELLGASLGTTVTADRSTVTLTALTANLRPSLELMADIVRNPAFATADVARVKNQRLASIAQEQAEPLGLAQRALGPLVFGEAHPYGSVGSSGLASAIERLTPEALAGVHRGWLRPQGAQFTVVGDVTMAELLPALEAAFGDWAEPQGARPAKDIAGAVPAPTPRIVVIDRPNSPQSVLSLARALPVTGRTPSLEALELANEVIGNGFLSRLNMNLREEKGWTYGIRSRIDAAVGPRLLSVTTPVQSDRTADAIRLILDEMGAFPATRGANEVEVQRVTEGNVRNLPTRFQTNAQVLGALLSNQLLGRPENYQASLPEIYRAIDAAAIDRAAAQYLQPAGLVIVVVGDRKQIDDQLATLGMEIEYREAGEF